MGGLTVRGWAVLAGIFGTGFVMGMVGAVTMFMMIAESGQ